MYKNFRKSDKNLTKLCMHIDGVIFDLDRFSYKCPNLMLMVARLSQKVSCSAQVGFVLPLSISKLSILFN